MRKEKVRVAPQIDGSLLVACLRQYSNIFESTSKLAKTLWGPVDNNNFMDKYKCPTCGELIKAKRLGSAIHDHYVREIGEVFLKKGCLVIQEGTIPSIPANWYDSCIERIKKVEYIARNWKNVVKKWREPDLIILKDNTLTKVIEVLGTAEDYRILAAKVAKINKFLKPPETIVFNAINYVDQFLDEKRQKKLEKILGFRPSTYKDVDLYYQQILQKECGLKFTIWSEENLLKIIESHQNAQRNNDRKC